MYNCPKCGTDNSSTHNVSGFVVSSDGKSAMSFCIKCGYEFSFEDNIVFLSESLKEVENLEKKEQNVNNCGEFVKRYKCHRCGRALGRMGPHRCKGGYWKKHSRFSDNYTEIMVKPKLKKPKKLKPKKLYEFPKIATFISLRKKFKGEK